MTVEKDRGGAAGPIKKEAERDGDGDCQEGKRWNGSDDLALREKKKMKPRTERTKNASQMP